MIDFSGCEIKHTKVYDGLNGAKIAIFYEKELYMLKFPKDTHMQNGYASSTINEHISSNIFKMLGFNTQHTLLGYYNDEVVVACKDFEVPNKRLFNFGKVKNSVIHSSNTFTDTDLEQTLQTIQNQKIIDPSTLREFFWDMFVVDTFIANFDRHNGNWGILVDEKTDKCSIAPVYDCGSSLYPKLNLQDINGYLTHQGSFNDLILNQTKSAITLNSKKINPQNFLFQNSDDIVFSSLKKITENINLDKINAFIDEIEIISKERKDFYKKVLKERKEKVLDAALDKCLNLKTKKEVFKILANKYKQVQPKIHGEQNSISHKKDKTR